MFPLPMPCNPIIQLWSCVVWRCAVYLAAKDKAMSKVI